MKLLLGAVLAAIVSFIWGFLSWSVLSWHTNGLHAFAEEGNVAQVIKDNAAVGHAIYMIPFHVPVPKDATAEEQKALKAKQDKAWQDGPFVYATVRRGKADVSMGANMAYSFGRSFLAALIIGGLLSLTAIPYMARVAFVAAAGLFAGLVCELPMHIWFELPARDLLVNMADHVIEWSLAGLILGIFAGKDPVLDR